MKKQLAAGLTALAAAALLAGCGGGTAQYADGTYTGQSEVYETVDEEEEGGNGYGVVEITIKDNAVTDCTFTTYEPDGTLKDENYGMEGGAVANRDYYNKAQKAVAACKEYAEQLVMSGNVDDIDAISGATINYNEFKEAVKKALKDAEKK